MGCRVALALVLLAPSAGVARTTFYAVVIGNNAVPLAPGSSALSPLRYADDDAVRYSQFFERFADRVALLSALDAETGRRYPDALAAARPPTLRELAAVIREAAKAMEDDLARGDRPVFYLTYSGHGARLEDGTAFFALIDGELTRERLGEHLRKLPASLIHVFVDACHAEAVVGPRGRSDKERDVRTVAVGDEQGAFLEEGGPKRLPTVGAIMATTADQEAHEWSRIQSGVFTHELLSGLSGAADVNGDGQVEYSEIQAFIASANRDLKDPRAIPRVVAHAPAVNARAPLVSLEWLRSAAFLRGQFGGLGHFRIELDDGQCYLDAHLSDEAVWSIAVPAGRRAFLIAGAREVGLRLSPGERIEVQRLVFENKPVGSRGSIESSYRVGFFRSPFGPSYYLGFADSVGIARVPFRSADAQTSEGRRSLRKPLAIAFLSLGGGAAVAAAVTGGLAIKAKSDYDATDLQRPAADARRRQGNFQTGALATAGLAVAAGVTGWLLWPHGTEPRVEVGFVPVGAGGAVAWSGSW